MLYIYQGSTGRRLTRIKTEMWTARFLVFTFIWTGMIVDCVFRQCNQSMFSINVEMCLMDFNKSMESSGNQDKCSWPTEKPIYNTLKHCVDKWAKKSWCKGQGFLVDEVFLEVHQKYFSLCGQIQDPPLFTLVMLITPGIIATLSLPLLCVHLVTWKL